MNHSARILTCAGPTSVPWGDHPRENHVHLESLYQATPFALSDEGPPARTLALRVDGWLGQEAARGQLLVDPSPRALNDFGDPTPGPRPAARTHDVALTRLRAPDPEAAGRTLFALTGAGLPADLFLVIYPYGDRVYLKRADALVPLYFDDGPRPVSTRR